MRPPVRKRISFDPVPLAAARIMPLVVPGAYIANLFWKYETVEYVDPAIRRVPMSVAPVTSLWNDRAAVPAEFGLYTLIPMPDAAFLSR